MRVAREPCARPENHAGKCMTAAALERMYSKQTAYHTSRSARRRAAIDEYKLERGCVDCGYRAHAVALDLDHRDPSVKIKGVSDMYTYSWSRVLEELAKCDVRCANCHRVKTHKTTKPPAVTAEGISARP